MISSLSDRRQYASLDTSTYLNQASLGLIGQPAVTAMHDFLDTVARHGNLHMSDRDEVAMLSELREPAARLFRCPPERLAILAGASEMLSQLPFLLRPPAGSRVLAVSSDFPAITRPWIAYARQHDCTVDFVDEDPTSDLTDDIIGSLDHRTSVVAVGHVQYSTGTVVDVQRLRDETERLGAALIVDVTQSAGAIPIDVTRWGAEAVVCGGYKWLGGHGGVGLAVMSPALLERPPPASGWMGADDPFDFRATELGFAQDARRYTQSTMSYVSVRGLTVSITELLAMGLDHIEAHAAALREFLFAGIESTGWSASGDREPGARAAPHIVALRSERRSVDEAMSALRGGSIVCSSRNARLRISLAHYNDENDVRTLTRVLRSC